METTVSCGVCGLGLIKVHPLGLGFRVIPHCITRRVPNNEVPGVCAIVIVIHVLGKYMIVEYLGIAAYREHIL